MWWLSIYLIGWMCQITDNSTDCSTSSSGWLQRKHRSSTSGGRNPLVTGGGFRHQKAQIARCFHFMMSSCYDSNQWMTSKRWFYTLCLWTQIWCVFRIYATKTKSFCSKVDSFRQLRTLRLTLFMLLAAFETYHIFKLRGHIFPFIAVFYNMRSPRVPSKMQ